jgi:hypothetical protein
MDGVSNLIPASFIETETTSGSFIEASSNVTSAYSEVVSSYSCKVEFLNKSSYIEETVPLVRPVVRDKLAHDFSIYHVNLPAIKTFPFESQSMGDDGNLAPGYTQRVTVYYKMIAKDSGSAGPTPTYRTWIVQNTPDTDGSRYPSSSPRDGNLVDIAISSSWEVSNPIT